MTLPRPPPTIPIGMMTYRQACINHFVLTLTTSINESSSLLPHSLRISATPVDPFRYPTSQPQPSPPDAQRARTSIHVSVRLQRHIPRRDLVPCTWACLHIIRALHHVHSCRLRRRQRQRAAPSIAPPPPRPRIVKHVVVVGACHRRCRRRRRRRRTHSIDTHPKALASSSPCTRFLRTGHSCKQNSIPPSRSTNSRPRARPPATKSKPANGAGFFSIPPAKPTHHFCASRSKMP